MVTYRIAKSEEDFSNKFRKVLRRWVALGALGGFISTAAFFDQIKQYIPDQLQELAMSIIEEEVGDQIDITNNSSTQISDQELKSMIKRFEGFEEKAYPDPIHGWSVPTIGYGTNLNEADSLAMIRGWGLSVDAVKSGRQAITKEQADQLFDLKYNRAVNAATRFVTNWNSQPSEVKGVIVDLIYNMGEERASKFVKFKAALENNNYKDAARELVDSNYYSQTGNRAKAHVATLTKLHASAYRSQHRGN